MKKLILIALLSAILFFGCKDKIQGGKAQIPEIELKSRDIIHNINDDKESFYYIDFKNYPSDDKSLPIGVFDSGIGGLTVLNAIVNYDQNQNRTHQKGNDGIIDFEKETFIYLGDQANMPYGNYSEVDKLDLLNEHIIKDTQFLLGNKYYSNADDVSVNIDKKPVKVIVIACNTATAYGKENIEIFLKRAKANIKVIGVIDAGVRGALEKMQKNEDGIIGVLATAGTVSSKGYHNTIIKFKDELGYKGNIEVFSQGGVGIAEAVDEDLDYFDKHLKKPRKNYKGPSFDGDIKISKTLLDIYNFDFDDSKMLCDSKKADDCSIIQINDAENYVRYHLVTLLEKIRRSNTKNKLKSIILGCTHYPYLTIEINNVLKEIYNYKNKKGNYLYRSYMVEHIQLIDPAINTAKELYDYLNQKSMFNLNGKINDSEFYISVANKNNKNNKIDENDRFPYDYKYGRNVGEIQEYTKIIPFSRDNISNDILIRFQEQIPYVFKLIKNFNRENEKTKDLKANTKI
tara:strand:+ start:12096 stop:13640 length:1545 start_codon:yes stop_codon:yes gene_type:complete